MIKAYAEYISEQQRKLASMGLAELKDELSEGVVGTYHNKRGGPVLKVNHRSEATALSSRIKHHKEDISAGEEANGKEEHAHSVKSHELATKARELHNTAHRVLKNPNSSEAEKTAATAKAVHATTKYWRHHPHSSHDYGSDTNEDRYYRTVRYHEEIADHPKD